MTHMAINRFRQLAYGQKQAAAKKVKEEDLAPRSYVTSAGRALTAPMGLAVGGAVGGGVAVGGLSAILAALLSKKENMLRNAVIAGAGGAAAPIMAGAIYGSLAKAYGQKQANGDPAILAAAKKVKAEDALAQHSYVTSAGRAQTAPMAG